MSVYCGQYRRTKPFLKNKKLLLQIKTFYDGFGMIYRMKQNAVDLPNHLYFIDDGSGDGFTTLYVSGSGRRPKVCFAHEVSVVSYYNAAMPAGGGGCTGSASFEGFRTVLTGHSAMLNITDCGAHGRWIFRDRHRSKAHITASTMWCCSRFCPNPTGRIIPVKRSGN